MALNPDNIQHAGQIEAGKRGRKKGHKFEKILAEQLSGLDLEQLRDFSTTACSKHLFNQNPALSLIRYIEKTEHVEIVKAKAWWVGALATSSVGDELIDNNNRIVRKSKSDIVLDILTNEGMKRIGVSVKSCSAKNPTNAQLYYTTATAFCNLLEQHNINVPESARKGLQQFCGDALMRPMDILSQEELAHRSPNRERFYWEEMSQEAQNQWKKIFVSKQNKIMKLLLQEAYTDDPYPPTYLIHATRKASCFAKQETAIFTIDELVAYSANFSSFLLRDYSVKKGTYKNDPYVHKAPSFGFVQFQRGGQKQHPTQLQFNLKSGYFYHVNSCCRTASAKV